MIVASQLERKMHTGTEKPGLLDLGDWVIEMFYYLLKSRVSSSETHKKRQRMFFVPAEPLTKLLGFN